MNTTHSFKSEGNVIDKLTKYKQISAKRRHEWFFFLIKNSFLEATEQVVQKDKHKVDKNHSETTWTTENNKYFY